jgi:pimeloyl-ACP methyl ester carboxylesterase
MKEQVAALSRVSHVSTKVAEVLSDRLRTALERYRARLMRITPAWQWGPLSTPIDVWKAWTEYVLDTAERSVLFWNTLCRRGDDYLEHERAGHPPLLHFQHETVMDGRTFEHPVNYALLRIIPPPDVELYPERRPYIIIDPRAGHGPGIGGFKDDSQIGVALRSGHPVYFVVFFPDPEPGQTLFDVCAAEATFVHKVRELHPESPKPAIVGNCQGGWAAMMLAAALPGDTGPIVINGAPMSYWGGAWREGEGDNPMRYAGGLLGGTWLASLCSDLGAGRFDGAHLVQNFEFLDPANTFWDKYYHLFANVDTESPRFLGFERWWGGFYLMNREEIEWITKTLFVGNSLWSGDIESKSGKVFDLREIRSPIILFASLGDNITPPQQAFNWVADVYGSTEDIKARGQVIVGLLHQDIGHLGIFVSGRVAKKEHSQIVSVMKSIEALPPGLYGMEIEERKGREGVIYEVHFVERRLEEVVLRLNRFERADEKAFEAVEGVSDFNQRAYELYARPLVQAVTNEFTAALGRTFHPLRVQRWAISHLNPWLAWLEPAAAAVRAGRRALDKDHPLRRAENALSEVLSASLDFGRDVRDAISEAAFFQIYGGLYSLHHPDTREVADRGGAGRTDPRTLPVVQKALESIAEGGYPEAMARVAALLIRGQTAIPLAQIELRAGLMEDYAAFLPKLSLEERRLIRGQQEVIVAFEPERALETLAGLLSDPADRARLLTLLERLATDPRVWKDRPAPEQLTMLERIRTVLGAGEPRAPPARPGATQGTATARRAQRRRIGKRIR